MSSSSDRRALRARLLALREQFAQAPQAALASAALQAHLARVLEALQPQTLGMYWPMRCEFNPRALANDDTLVSICTFALPYCTRTPRHMTYRAWDGAEPAVRDECGIATSAGAAVVPDVVLAPCLGYTKSGHRVGYGGGYFDRFLAAHPHVTAVGVAWVATEIGERDYTAEPHDVPMMLIVTESGVVA